MNHPFQIKHDNVTSAKASRRAGTPTIAAIAIAAACVLAACGPDEQIANVPVTSAPVASHQVTPTSRQPATAATVAPSMVVQVADRYDNAAPRAVYGQISSIEPITQTPKTSGAGAVVGGVLGAVVGNQIGSGNGRAATTVLGGVGGAVLGNKVEKNRSENVVGYRVHVQLDNGSTRSFERNSLDGLDVGARVRVDGGRLRRI